MTADLVSGIVGAGVAAVIVLAGGTDVEVGLLAAVSGLTFIAAGLGLRALAMRALGGSLGVRLHVRDDGGLVHAGPYKWIRHPNYAGLILIAGGIAVSFSSSLALFAAVCLWLPALLLHIAREERMLIERFGRQYRAYMSRTWRLIVGIY